MKRKFSKILGVGLVLALIVALLVVFATGIFATDPVLVDEAPTTAGAVVLVPAPPPEVESGSLLVELEAILQNPLYVTGLTLVLIAGIVGLTILAYRNEARYIARLFEGPTGGGPLKFPHLAGSVGRGAS